MEGRGNIGLETFGVNEATTNPEFQKSPRRHSQNIRFQRNEHIKRIYGIAVTLRGSPYSLHLYGYTERANT